MRAFPEAGFGRSYPMKAAFTLCRKMSKIQETQELFGNASHRKVGADATFKVLLSCLLYQKVQTSHKKYFSFSQIAASRHLWVFSVGKGL